MARPHLLWSALIGSNAEREREEERGMRQLTVCRTAQLRYGHHAARKQPRPLSRLSPLLLPDCLPACALFRLLLSSRGESRRGAWERAPFASLNHLPIDSPQHSSAQSGCHLPLPFSHPTLFPIHIFCPPDHLFTVLLSSSSSCCTVSVFSCTALQDSKRFPPSEHRESSQTTSALPCLPACLSQLLPLAGRNISQAIFRVRASSFSLSLALVSAYSPTP